MNYTAEKNTIFFNSLKNKISSNTLIFPNLTNFKIINNSIIYTENNTSVLIHLGNVELWLLDESLFKLQPNEIFYVINNIAKIMNKPEELDKKIEYMKRLLILSYIEKEHETYIYNYLNDFYTRKNMSSKFKHEKLDGEIDKMIVPICMCYDDNLPIYNNPAAAKTRELEKQYYTEALSNGSSSENAYVRQRKSKNNVVSFPSDTSYERLDRIAGFMSATFIISIIAIIGLILAIVLLAFNLL